MLRCHATLLPGRGPNTADHMYTRYRTPLLPRPLHDRHVPPIGAPPRSFLASSLTALGLGSFGRFALHVGRCGILFSLLFCASFVFIVFFFGGAPWFMRLFLSSFAVIAFLPSLFYPPAPTHSLPCIVYRCTLLCYRPTPQTPSDPYGSCFTYHRYQDSHPMALSIFLYSIIKRATTQKLNIRRHLGPPLARLQTLLINCPKRTLWNRRAIMISNDHELHT